MTDETKSDIFGIYEYVAYELHEETVARGLYDRILNRTQGLSVMPERFRIFESATALRRSLRVMPVENYSVLYYVDTNDCKVIIIRVVYSKRGLDALAKDL